MQRAVQRQGRRLLNEPCIDAAVVAVDQTLIAALGPPGHRRRRRRRGVDPDAGWGVSEHHGWIYGYSLEVVVTACEGSLTVPLLASAGPGNTNGARSFLAQVEHLPEQTGHVLADRGYDTNDCADAVECDAAEQPTGRRLVGPLIARVGKAKVGAYHHRGRRERRRRRRAQRLAFFQSETGQRLYARRGKTVEPFNEWFKQKFHLHDRVWHRGLGNNQTQLLTAMFAYQLLVRYQLRRGATKAEIQWILDAL